MIVSLILIWKRFKGFIITISLVLFLFLFSNLLNTKLLRNRIDRQDLLEGKTKGRIISITDKKILVQDEGGARFSRLHFIVSYSYTVNEKIFYDIENIKNLESIANNYRDSLIEVKYSLHDPKKSLIKLDE